MTITDLGWVVVHSLWQGLFIAGLTALALGLVREPRAQALRVRLHEPRRDGDQARITKIYQISNLNSEF